MKGIVKQSQKGDDKITKKVTNKVQKVHLKLVVIKACNNAKNCKMTTTPLVTPTNNLDKGQ
jgi:predicted GTPase